MHIHETCDNGPWELDFNCEVLDRTGMSEDQKQVVHRVFHTLADVVSWLAGFSDNNIINPALVVLYSEVNTFAEKMQTHLSELLDGRIWLETPAGEYAYDTVFGGDVFAEMASTLEDPNEHETYMSAFPFNRGRDLTLFTIGDFPDDPHADMYEDEEDDEDDEEWKNLE